MRSLGFLCFGVPLIAAPRLQRRRRSALGAYLIGMPFGLAGCPTCALVLPSVLVAVAASGNPILRALAML